MSGTIRSFCCGAVMVLLSGCYSNTRITGSWKDPQTSRKYGSVFVAALSANAVARSTVETEMTAALVKRGLQASKSIEAFPPHFAGKAITKDTLLRVVKEKGADVILTISLLKKETEARYVSGGYAPATRYDYYNSFGGYYNYWSPYAYSPGYYEQHDVYYLETNLYDSTTEKLVWSGQSRTYNYDDLNGLAREYVGLVVDKMRADGILK